jgi:hypothetical protein
MKVTKKDGTNFEVCVDGEGREIKVFFEEVLSIWQSHKRANKDSPDFKLYL